MRSPEKTSDYITYEVTGYDNKGDFIVRKRYSEFYNLRKVLSARWPGFYIPSLPPKKSIGNMENKFINSRMQHLDNFIKQIGQYQFLVESFEFSIFVRYSHEQCDEQYHALLEQTPQQIYDKFQAIVEIDPLKMAKTQRMTCSQALQKF